MHRKKILNILGCMLLAALFILSATQPLEAKPADREYTIKAGLIIKFLDFIEWPTGEIKKNNNPQYKLCILGKNRFENLFSHGKVKIILRVNVDDQEIKSCNIIFIAGENLLQLKRAIKELKNHPALIIGESENHGRLGADINLIKKQNKIKFEINRGSLKNKGLKISSYLLNLAIIVGNESQ